MKKLNILITGSTGGIGEELTTQLLAAEYEIYAPVRNLAKAREKFGEVSNLHTAKINLEDFDNVQRYCQERSDEGVLFDYVLLIAGDMQWDSDIGTEEESKVYHERMNVLTAQTVVQGLEKAYDGRLRRTTLFGESSWSVDFALDNPYRENEEGYIFSKIRLGQRFEEWTSGGRFATCILMKTKFVKSPMTKRMFPKLYDDPTVPKKTTAEHVADIRALLNI